MWYLPLLSLNGILEAFHASTATPAEVARQARWMIGGSGVFVLSLGGLTHLPIRLGSVAVPRPTTEQALIYSSCAAMVVRIDYAYNHAVRYARRTAVGTKSDNVSITSSAVTKMPSVAPRKPQLSVLEIIPQPPVILVSLASGAVLRVLHGSARWKEDWRGWGELIGLGGAMGVAILGVM
jgi:oligosaccharide translocation protein RFT1